MLHKEKQDSRTGRGCSKPGRTAVLSFVCAEVVRAWISCAKLAKPQAYMKHGIECSTTHYKYGYNC